MGLKAKLKKDDFTRLSAELQKLYKAEEGGESFLLDVDEVDGVMLDNVGGLKTTLGDIKNDRDGLKKKIKEWGDITPDQAREAISLVNKLKSGDLDDKAKALVESQLKQLEAKFAAEAKGKDDRIGHLTKTLEQSFIHDAARAAITDPEVKGNPDLLLPIVVGALRMEEVEGKFATRVLGEDGKPRISLQRGNTGPMSVKEYVSLLKKEAKYAPAFEGAGATGGGSGGNSQPSGGSHVISAADARDVMKYRNARAAAEKAGVQLTIQE